MGGAFTCIFTHTQDYTHTWPMGGSSGVEMMDVLAVLVDTGAFN